MTFNSLCRDSFWGSSYLKSRSGLSGLGVSSMIGGLENSVRTSFTAFGVKDFYALRLQAAVSGQPTGLGLGFRV